jgi:peptidoglycan/LPS O-acetylase OafA/YrhL
MQSAEIRYSGEQHAPQSALSSSGRSAAMNRIPALDGWRGIAIALVLFDHIQASILRRHISDATSTGYHGVALFFVLSGFLITSKLLEGPINFRRFYLRRFFRLMPAAWTYLAFLLLFSAVTRMHFTSGREVISCVFCFRNFLGKMGFAGHFWSLSIEEQFYLVWPLTLFLAGVARARWIALLGGIACAVFRTLEWARYGPQFPTGPSFLHSDWLLIGCFGALMLHDQRIRAGLTRVAPFLALPALCTFIYCMTTQSHLLAESFSLSALLIATTLHPRGLCARAVSGTPITWLGRVSYSVYLWQGFFLAQHQLWAYIATPVFALASYYFIESPSTRFGHRITREPSSPSRDSDAPSSLQPQIGGD